MGYTTDFWGEIELFPALTKEQNEYLTAFSETRRMKRDISKLKGMSPWFVPSFGVDGEYYVGAKDDGQMGQSDDGSVIERNIPPRTQPGLWCHWVPTDNGKSLMWDEGEKFYEYTAWMEYILRSFLDRWGVKANGIIEWHGEDPNDRGRLVVEDSHLKVQTGTVVYR